MKEKLLRYKIREVICHEIIFCHLHMEHGHLFVSGKERRGKGKDIL